MGNKVLNDAACKAGGIQGRPFVITDFTYNNSVVLKLIKRHLHTTNFTGISVRFALIKPQAIFCKSINISTHNSICSPVG